MPTTLRFLLRLGATLLVLMAAVPRSSAQTCADYGSYVYIAGVLPIPGIATRLHVEADRAYVGGGGMLHVIDVSDPTSPTSLGSLQMPHSVYGVDVDASLAYVACAYAGFFVVDVSDPQSMFVVGSLDTSDFCLDVRFGGRVKGKTYAYVADRSGGFLVVDVSDPANPTLATSITGDDARSLELDGSMIYVAQGYHGWMVVDVSTPASAAVVLDRPHEDSGTVEAIARTGSCAALVGDAPYLKLVDVTDPTAPVALGSYGGTLANYGQAAAASGDLVYAGAESNRLLAIDVSNPNNPRLVESARLPDRPRGIRVVGNYAYVADRGGGLQVVDIAQPIPPVVGSTSLGGTAVDVARAGNLAVVSMDVEGVAVIDVSDAVAPQLLGSVATAAQTRGVDAQGTHAYVAAHDQGLQIVDLADPANPTLVTTVPTPDRAQDVHVSGSFAFVADLFSGLQVVHVSNPQAPSIVGSSDTPGRSVRVQVQGGLAYVADLEGGLRIFDVSNPYAPLAQGNSVGIPVAEDVVVDGSTAYVAGGDASVYVVDVSDPSSPTVVTTIATSDNVGRILLRDGILYAAVRDMGFELFDVAQIPATLVGTAMHPNTVNGVVGVDGHLWVAGDTDGFVVLPAQCTTPTDVETTRGTVPTVLSAWPNPSAGTTSLFFETRRAGSVQVAVFDVRGRRVRNLLHERRDPGAHACLWDGRDDAGRAVANGTYLVRLVTPTRSTTARVVHLR